jgi:hypothetical protein
MEKIERRIHSNSDELLKVLDIKNAIDVLKS